MRLMTGVYLFASFIAAATGAAVASGQATLSDRDLYKAAVAQVDTNATAALEAMTVLAQRGYPRAHDRLGYFALKGIGRPASPEDAIGHYEMAVQLGHQRALIALAKTQANLGMYEQALASFDQSLHLNVENARTDFLIYHAVGKLGDYSQPEQAWAALNADALAGDRMSLVGILYVAAKTGQRIPQEADILAMAIAQAKAGDTKVSEKLLPYLRIHRASDAQGHEIRGTLLKQDNLRSKIRTEERLYLASERRPDMFSVLSSEILQNAEPQDYARALFITSRISKNAFVREVQQELSKLGYNPGKASGYLTNQSILAIARFCRDTQIADICRHGPLKSAAIKVISAELSEMK